MTVKEELDGTGTGDIGNLENLIRIVFIHENVRTLKYLWTVEGLLKILTNRRRSQAFFKLIGAHSVTNVVGEGISSIRMWNNVNQ